VLDGVFTASEAAVATVLLHRVIMMMKIRARAFAGSLQNPGFLV
jgi:hypothetical protein